LRDPQLSACCVKAEDGLSQQDAAANRYGLSVRDVGIASARDPDVYRDAARGSIHLTFRGTSDARSSVDRDTRIRIAISGIQAVRLWQALGECLTDDEKRQGPL
jgi:hypothetical protein